MKTNKQIIPTMKTLLSSTCLTALIALSNPINAQTTKLDNLLSDNSEQAKPQTTIMKVASLKTRHSESLSTLKTALNRILAEPSLITSKSTFEAIDKGDRDMKRSQGRCKSIISALRSELSSIKQDSAYSDDQKQELENAITTLAEECATVHKEADIVIKNLNKSYKLFPQWKKIYKSYLNIQGEKQAGDQIKGFVEEYVSSLAEAPVEVKPTAEDEPVAEEESE